MVHVVFGPAELIEIKGEPRYDAIVGTGLEYVAIPLATFSGLTANTTS
jgi:hypothetical protein